MALTDMTGKIVEGYLYDAYGRHLVFEPGPIGKVDFGGNDDVTPGGEGAVNNPFMFTGRRFDPETSLYYFRARYLDPELGRFIARDTIGTWSDGANLGNAYAYAGNNPVNAVDPTGNFISLGVPSWGDVTNTMAQGVMWFNNTFGVTQSDTDAFVKGKNPAPIVERVFETIEEHVYGPGGWEEFGERAGGNWLTAYWWAAGDLGRDVMMGTVLFPWENPLPGLPGGKDLANAFDAHMAGKPVSEIAGNMLANEWNQLKEFVAESLGVNDFVMAYKAEGWGWKAFYIYTGTSKFVLTVLSLGVGGAARTAGTSAPTFAGGQAKKIISFEGIPSAGPLTRAGLTDELMRYASPHQPGKTILVDPVADPALFRMALENPRVPGAHQLYVHSTPTQFFMGGKPVFAMDISRQLAKNPGYRSGMPIHAYACRSGDLVGGPAAQLAFIEQGLVWAPDRLVAAVPIRGGFVFSNRARGASVGELLDPNFMASGEWVVRPQ
jgi:RHS repeat-associated protein